MRTDCINFIDMTIHIIFNDIYYIYYIYYVMKLKYEIDIEIKIFCVLDDKLHLFEIM